MDTFLKYCDKTILQNTVYSVHFEMSAIICGIAFVN